MAASKHTTPFDIDRYGRVACNGTDVTITTPRVAIPFGVEQYNNTYVINLELLTDSDTASANRKFIRRFNRAEAELERQLDGNFISSLRGSFTVGGGTKVRTRAMTGSRGTITSELTYRSDEIGILELKKGDIGIFVLKLQKAWTMTDPITNRDTAGGVWVIASGEIVHRVDDDD